MNAVTRTSLTETAEHVDVRPGPALLRHAGRPADLAAHRAAYGQPPSVGLEELVGIVETGSVRGRGGAGFPFARKLRAASEHTRAFRRPVVVVNASEGEPASAKDATLAAAAPHLVLDGAAVTAAALGARDIHVVLPGDRPRAGALLGAAVRERSDLRIRWHLHVAEPRFVSGQARAVLELLAGRPGLPVTAWQPEAIAGHGDRPTLLSNAETWAHVGRLVLEGPDAVLAQGTPSEPGTTLLTVHAPGRRAVVVEVEHGTPMADVLPPSAYGAPVLVGGFHGTWTTWHDIASAPVSAQALRERGLTLGAGVVIALDRQTCAVDATADIVDYLAGQSAGRCGPCLNGLPALARAVRGLRDGVPGAHTEVLRLSGVIPGRGACAHPDGTTRLVASLLERFPDEVAAHQHGRCGAHAPTGVAS